MCKSAFERSHKHKQEEPAADQILPDQVGQAEVRANSRQREASQEGCAFYARNAGVQLPAWKAARRRFASQVDRLVKLEAEHRSVAAKI